MPHVPAAAVGGEQVVAEEQARAVACAEHVGVREPDKRQRRAPQRAAEEPAVRCRRQGRGATAPCWHWRLRRRRRFRRLRPVRGSSSLGPWGAFGEVKVGALGEQRARRRGGAHDVMRVLGGFKAATTGQRGTRGLSANIWTRMKDYWSLNSSSLRHSHTITRNLSAARGHDIVRIDSTQARRRSLDAGGAGAAACRIYDKILGIVLFHSIRCYVSLLERSVHLVELVRKSSTSAALPIRITFSRNAPPLPSSAAAMAAMGFGRRGC